MRNLQKNRQKGITLIALVITILVLIILAGVTINLTIGENGIFSKAKYAKEKYTNEEYLEQEQLNELYAYLAKDNSLPENTKDTEAGTQVKLPSSWYTTTAAYVSTEDGKIVTKEIKTASVTAVATGGGETVPVPNGFYYVGGTKDSGVVISSDKRDQNKYAGVVDVPAGAVYNSDGTAKTYADTEYEKLTDDEKKAVILGDQFIWIPVTAEEYKKSNTWNGKTQTSSSLANATWETQTNTAELAQIQKYSGFYIGRYEAGTSEITLSTGVNFAAQNTASGWQNANFSIKDGSGNTATGKVTTKAGEIPYYHSDYFTACKLSSSMYSTNYVQSGLVTGTMWDAMLKFIGRGNEAILTSSTWGNYNNTSSYVTYTAGQGRYGTVDSSSGAMTAAFKVSDGKYYYGIKTTAISENVKQKNLYDVAGNLWEWTQEASYPNNTLESYMLRGGSFHDRYSDSPACFRVYLTATYTNTHYGFRPALYIK